MAYNKLVIRRLPPNLSEDEFLKQISPLPKHDYFAFFEANSGLGKHCFSRAYINFIDPNDMSVFRDRFDNYVFLDGDGNEYPAVVEQSLWHKSPKSGPFYKNSDELETNQNTGHQHDWKQCAADADKNVESVNDQNSSNNMFHNEDPDFLKFVEKINSQKRAQPAKH